MGAPLHASKQPRAQQSIAGRPLMLMLGILAAVALLAGCGGGDEENVATTSDASAADTGSDTSAGSLPDDESGDDAGPANRAVMVRNLVTEAEADEAIALLTEHGYDGFIKRVSEQASDGWDVVKVGLTITEADALAVDVVVDPDIPYAGVLLAE